MGVQEAKKLFIPHEYGEKDRIGEVVLMTIFAKIVLGGFQTNKISMFFWGIWKIPYRIIFGINHEYFGSRH